MGKRISEDLLTKETVEEDDEIVVTSYSISTPETIEVNSIGNEKTLTKDDVIEKTKIDLYGSCACGNVKIVVPKGSTILLSGYCHCTSCQKFSSCPVTSCFGIPAIEVPDCPTEVETDILGFTQMTVNGPRRFYCKKCSVYMYSHWDSFLGFNHIPFNAFLEIPPKYHVNYIDKVISMKDGLPKYKAYPPCSSGMPSEILED